ncbi:MAG: alpha-ketoglutarate-dependent dioxygenase AlkB family protein [Terriglobales bacterium]
MKAAIAPPAPPAPPPIRYWPRFLDPVAADRAFQALRAELPWRRHVSRMYGREVPVPRLEAWIATHPYTYSRRRYEPSPWTPSLELLKAAVEAAAGCAYNSVLANLYENEADSVGWHADDEPEMSPEHPIASLSLGAAREFQMRRGNEPATAMTLAHGSLLLMAAGMQREWRHRLPKARRPCGPRINLTFRRMTESGGQ